MAEKIRPLHLPTNSAPSQQTLLVASSPLDGGQHSMLMPKSQQGQHHPQGSVQQPDIALHARTASSSVPGRYCNSVCSLLSAHNIGAHWRHHLALVMLETCSMVHLNSLKGFCLRNSSALI
jgi:hypothetical protein